MIATETIASYSQFPRQGDTSSMGGQMDLSQDRGSGVNVSKRLDCGFTGLGLTGLNNFSGL